MPRWSGGETFRGISVNNQQLLDFKPGKIIDMRGIASWSATIDIAKEYATKNINGEYCNPVVYHCDTQTKGTGIKHLSLHPEEDEVLCSMESIYIIENIQRDIDDVVHIYVREV